jgi:hypothetical protein
MPEPLPPELRQTVLNEIRQGTHSRAQIARNNGIAPSTVGKIARDAGITDAFARTQTENATRARMADNKARRIELAAKLLSRTFELDERAWAKHTVVAGGPDGPEKVELDKPPPRDVQALYTAVGILVQRHLELENFDREDNKGDERSMLTMLFEQLAEARRPK